MRKQVDQEIDKLLKSDIIEPVDGPVPWVSPIVAVPNHPNRVMLGSVLILHCGKLIESCCS